MPIENLPSLLIHYLLNSKCSQFLTKEILFQQYSLISKLLTKLNRYSTKEEIRKAIISLLEDNFIMQICQNNKSCYNEFIKNTIEFFTIYFASREDLK